MSESPQLVPITPQKHDPAWKHCQMFKDGEKVLLKCLYCGKLTKGGGIRRMKEHLACQKGNGAVCTQVPTEVRLSMQQSLGQSVGRARKGKRNSQAKPISSLPPGEIDTFSSHSKGENDMPLPPIDAYFDKCGLGAEDHLVRVPISFHNPNAGLMVSQDEIMGDERGDRRKRRRDINSCVIQNYNAFGVKNVKKELISTTIGKFLYDIGAPPNAVNSVYFQPMVDAIISGGSGIIAPSSQDIRGCILKEIVEEEKKEIVNFRAIWRRTGCSILVEQWNTEAGRKLLNFLVYCPEGTVFLRSVDASNTIYSTDDLYELLRQVVEEVGVSHVLQVITESEEQYIVAGKRLYDTYPTLYWVPCGVHCIELMLEDFAKVVWINERIEHAKFITRFIYNNSVVLNMMRRYTSGNDIVVPGISRASTNFTTLKRLIDLQQSLVAMFTSQEWIDCPCSKELGGLAMSDIINNDSFWSSCFLIVHLTSPLLQVLRMVNSEKKPTMGYIYAGMYRAKEAIKKKLVKREDYMLYWNIIDQRWEKQWNLPLHDAGFYLNPKIFYCVEGDVRSKFQTKMFDCIERLIPDVNVQDKIIKEMNLYKNAAGDLGRNLAIRARDSLHPVEWWETYGGGCPNLSKLAIRILGQTCSSFISKQNQIPFEKLHASKNCIERQRLNDLVFVQYNMRLKQIVGKNSKHDCSDPTSIENMNIVEDWIKTNDSYGEDYGSSDWTVVEVPSTKMGLLGQEDGEVEELDTGFNDHEIFSRAKEEAL